MSDLLTIRRFVPASHQMSEFANATLTALDDGTAVSISISPPADVRLNDIVEELRGLTQIGWAVEITHGRDDQ